jgi:TetR/AcrR family transcriptional repressor of nem operon
VVKLVLAARAANAAAQRTRDKVRQRIGWSGRFIDVSPGCRAPIQRRARRDQDELTKTRVASDVSRIRTALGSRPSGLTGTKTTGHIGLMPRPSLREQLLYAGLEILQRKGFNGTSVQDITDAAGAPKGSFYNHFVSKEALAAEAVRRYRENRRARLGILQDARLKPLRRLRKYFESLNQAAVEGRFSKGCLLGNFGAELSGQSALVRAQVREGFTAWCDAIALAIAEAQKDGAVSRTLRPRALAQFVVHAWEGAMVRAKVDNDRAPLDLFVKITFAKILT